MRVPALSLPRALRLIVATVLLLVGAGALLAGPAAAHVSLTGSTPAAGSQVDTAPTQVELTYSAALLEVGNAVQVTGPAGALTLEPLQVAERSLVQPLPADLPPGEYTVQWRAASGDGHPIEGTLTFTSTAAAPTTSGPTSSAPAPTSSSAAGTSSEPAPSGPSPDTTSDEAAGPADPSDPSRLPLWVGVPVALLGAAGVAAIALRRGRRPGDHG